MDTKNNRLTGLLLTYVCGFVNPFGLGYRSGHAPQAAPPVAVAASAVMAPAAVATVPAATPCHGHCSSPKRRRVDDGSDGSVTDFTPVKNDTDTHVD